MEQFVNWYNNEYCRIGIQYVTPNERHTLKDTEILAKRTFVYQLAKEKNPSRWSGEVRNWKRVEEVELNPTNNQKIEAQKGAA